MIHDPVSVPFATDASLNACGVVVIGRNEGERLKRCLDSVRAAGARVVYVDSGSTDGSDEWARVAGIDLVALDMSVPFTAARARNAGFARLCETAPALRFVQFVDGDCEITPDWLRVAVSFLEGLPEAACVCGRLRERFPDRSIYNRLCDIEWNRPVGETDSCGGIVMMRSDRFAAVGGFRESLIAGEEPDLCLRLRARGGRIWRVAEDMAWHDAAMTRFGQWWRRAMRGGHALAEGMAMHGKDSSASDKRRLRRVLGWGMALPSVVLVLAPLHPAWLALLAVYPLRFVRLAWKASGIRPSAKWLWAGFMVLSSFPEAAGVSAYWLNRSRARRAKLIEYK